MTANYSSQFTFVSNSAESVSLFCSALVSKGTLFTCSTVIRHKVVMNRVELMLFSMLIDLCVNCAVVLRKSKQMFSYCSFNVCMPVKPGFIYRTCLYWPMWPFLQRFRLLSVVEPRLDSEKLVHGPSSWLLKLLKSVVGGDHSRTGAYLDVQVPSF